MELDYFGLRISDCGIKGFSIVDLRLQIADWKFGIADFRKEASCSSSRRGKKSIFIPDLPVPDSIRGSGIQFSSFLDSRFRGNDIQELCFRICSAATNKESLT